METKNTGKVILGLAVVVIIIVSGFILNHFAVINRWLTTAPIIP